jgi:hypothetical protein
LAGASLFAAAGFAAGICVPPVWAKAGMQAAATSAVPIDSFFAWLLYLVFTLSLLIWLRFLLGSRRYG